MTRISFSSSKPGAFGYLSPEEEQWYMNMRWATGKGYPNNYRHKSSDDILREN
jgi:hypothetical protein